MKEKLTFVEFLFKDLLKNAKIHAENKEVRKKECVQLEKGQLYCYPSDWNYRDKNHGKTVLKRKIIFLRQELLNLERMLDE